MKQVIKDWVGTDEDLLTELNRKQFKRKIDTGMVTLAMIAAVDKDLSALLGYRIESLINAMPIDTEQDRANKRQVEKFLFRLEGSDLGLDFHNDEIRNQFTILMTATGFNSTQIDTVLNIGAVLDSYAYQSLRRNATQEDIDEIRRDIYNEELRSKALDASALFISRSEQAGSAWTTQEQIAQWASAWEEA